MSEQDAPQHRHDTVSCCGCGGGHCCCVCPESSGQDATLDAGPYWGNSGGTPGTDAVRPPGRQG